jgi:hypothetical protein
MWDEKFAILESDAKRIQVIDPPCGMNILDRKSSKIYKKEDMQFP